MRGSRRGFIAQETIIKTVMYALCFLILAAFAMNAMVPMRVEAQGNDLACKISVMQRLKVTVAGMPLADLSCTMQERTTEGDVEVVKADIAGLANRCWWMFANGYSTKILAPVATAPVCFICYTVSVGQIEKLAPNKEGFTEQELTLFMFTTPYERLYTQSEQEQNKDGVEPDIEEPLTYLEYIQYGGKGVLKIEPGIEFKAGELYAIAFFEPHGKEAETKHMLPAIYIDTLTRLIDGSGEVKCNE